MKKNLLFNLFLLVFTNTIFGQTDSAYIITDNPAQFPNGGQPEFYKYMIKNLKLTNTTDSSYQDCTSFIVRFTIEKDGRANDIQFLKVCSNPNFKSQIIEAFKRMPLWKPATSKGVAVRMMFTMPFHIKLE